jgi:hypothetical protein
MKDTKNVIVYYTSGMACASIIFDHFVKHGIFTALFEMQMRRSRLEYWEGERAYTI